MPQTFVECPYCDTKNHLAIIRRTSRSILSLDKGFGTEETTSTEKTSYDLTCQLCRREFIFIDSENYFWLKNNLNPSDTMLVSLKSKFPEADLDTVFDNIKGVTRPKGTLRQLYKRNRLHI